MSLRQKGREGEHTRRVQPPAKRQQKDKRKEGITNADLFLTSAFIAKKKKEKKGMEKGGAVGGEGAGGGGGGLRTRLYFFRQSRRVKGMGKGRIEKSRMAAVRLDDRRGTPSCIDDSFVHL